MKRPIFFKSIIVFIFIVLNQIVRSQSCTVDYIDPYSYQFPIEGGSTYVTVHTYPYNCGPSLSFPSWINMYQVSEETYIVVCQQNYENSSRSFGITVGNDYMDIFQQGVPLDPGSIGGPDGESSLTICYNSAPGTLTNKVSPSGGDCSTYYYQWQISTDGSTFSDIPESTDLTFIPGNLTATRYYRRKVTCYGEDFFSNTVPVVVGGQLSGGTISGTQAICYNTSPSSFTQSAPSGGSGTYSYLCAWSPDIGHVLQEECNE
jgi:hypothetical protein